MLRAICCAGLPVSTQVVSSGSLQVDPTERRAWEVRQFGGSPVSVIADEAIIVDARELLGITKWVPGRGHRANNKLEGLSWEELHALAISYDRSVSLHPPGPKAALGCTCLV